MKKKGAPFGTVNNPEGKGGFVEHPENRGSGRWKKEDSIGEQYNMLIRLTAAQFSKWETDHPEDERTVAQDLAYASVREARTDLKYLVEVTDRTEGKAPQKIIYDGELTNKFDDEQIDRIASRLSERKRDDGGTPSE